MFKKISLLLLAISSSYAMESLPNTPTGDDNDNIKQTTEDIKTVPENNENKTEGKINDNADDISVLNIDKTVQQLNSINIQDDKNKTSNNEFTNKDVFFYDASGERLVDLKKLITRPFKTMSEEEKDWSRLKMYDWFSGYCQTFMRQVLAKNELNTEMWNKFLEANPTKYCIMVGLDPHDIFKDVLKFDINLECYQNQATIGTFVRLVRLGKRLVPIKQSYRKQILKAGFVDGF